MCGSLILCTTCTGSRCPRQPGWWCHHVCVQWWNYVNRRRIKVSLTFDLTCWTLTPSDELSSSTSGDDEVADKTDQSDCRDDSLSDDDRPIRRKRLKLSGVGCIATGDQLPAANETMLSVGKYVKRGWIDEPPYCVRYLRNVSKHSHK